MAGSPSYRYCCFYGKSRIDQWPKRQEQNLSYTRIIIMVARYVAMSEFGWISAIVSGETGDSSAAKIEEEDR